MAVSSAVSCSFKNSMTRASPRILAHPSLVDTGSVGEFGWLRGDWYALLALLLVDQLTDAVEACATAGPRATGFTDRLLGLRAVPDDGADLGFAYPLADTRVHAASGVGHRGFLRPTHRFRDASSLRRPSTRPLGKANLSKGALMSVVVQPRVPLLTGGFVSPSAGSMIDSDSPMHGQRGALVIIVLIW